MGIFFKLFSYLWNTRTRVENNENDNETTPLLGKRELPHSEGLGNTTNKVSPEN